MPFERITVDPAVATGEPCIRNLRFAVSRLLGLLASRETRESILSAYPYLEEADIDEALRYSACLSAQQPCIPASIVFLLPSCTEPSSSMTRSCCALTRRITRHPEVGLFSVDWLGNADP
jgi:uncharacterized protein (DUF433 family)